MTYRFDPTYRDCIREAAASTGDRLARERSWCIVPEEPKAPKAVWIAMAWGIGLTCLFVFTPVIVRFLMGES